MGVNVEITPRVTFEGEVILELLIENSALGEGLNVAGQNLPSFTSRKVVTKLRLRDGESNLLAGLLQEEERKSLRGFPGILRLPIIRQLFSANDNTIGQTDIVMLLTPRIVRTHELTASDLTPDLHRHAAEPGAVGTAVAHRVGPAVPADPRLRHASAGTRRRPPLRRASAPAPAAPAGGSGTSRRAAPAARRPPRRRVGTGPDFASERRVPRRRRPLHAADFGHRRVADVVDVADGHLQPGRAARAQRAGRQLHAVGRRAGRLHDQPGRRRAHRHRGGQAWGLDGRGRHGTSGGHPLRRRGGRAGQLDGDRHGDGARRRALVAAVRPGNAGDGAGNDVGCASASTRQDGYSFIELLIVISILFVLASAAMPLAQVASQRQREVELRRTLREMRTAIDKFKDAVDIGQIPTTELTPGSEGYPPDLETLVEGVTPANDASGRKLKFLRRVPIDPMTNSTEWGMRAYQDARTPRRGAAGTCSTCTRRARARGSTARSTRTGKWYTHDLRLDATPRRHMPASRSWRS